MAMTELQALLDAAVDAIIVIDELGSITTFNAAAERLFGYAAADVIGQPVEVLMPEPYHSAHHSYIERYLATGEPHIIGIGREVLGRRANGETFPIALSVGEARAANGRRFVGIIRDLSAQRAAEIAHSIDRGSPHPRRPLRPDGGDDGGYRARDQSAVERDRDLRSGRAAHSRARSARA